MLLLSGGPGFAASYLNGLAGALSAKYRVLLPDQRGTGLTPSAGPSDLTLDAYVDDLEQLRASSGAERWSIVGHSWGAMLALAYAERYADKVDSLVLVNLASLSAEVFDTLLPELMKRLDPERLDQATALLGQMPTAADPNAVLFELFLTLQPAYFKDQAHADRFVHWISSETISLPTYNALSADLKKRGFDLRGKLAHVRMPVLLLSGAEDPFGAAPLNAAQQELPQATVVHVADAAHYPMLEQPSSTITEVMHFLSGVYWQGLPATTPDVSGDWKVTVHQEVNGAMITVRGQFKLEQEGSMVKGTGTLNFMPMRKLIRHVPAAAMSPLHYEVTGSVKDEFMEHAYKNMGSEVGQYGHMMVRILDEDHMYGKFQGFGPEHRIVINGTVEYERIR